TIAKDGKIIPEVTSLLDKISGIMDIYILTADTFGTATQQCSNLNVKLQCLESSDHTYEKCRFVTDLGSSRVIAVGNGNNDLEMLRVAQIGIGVIGQEGCAAGIYNHADIIVGDILNALRLLVYPQRLIATLRR
ncbi:MAG: HAD hydrolase family protein, partial [Desulfobacterales bacterium]|nr:HAD hydrolase family protein [Desulfobacterales bacterium]